MEPLLQSLVSLLPQAPDEYDANTSEAFFKLVHAEFMRRREDQEVATPFVSRTYKGQPVDRSRAPSWQDTQQVLEFMYHIPYRRNVEGNKDDARVTHFRSQHAIPFGRFLPQAIYYGPN